MYVVYSNVRTGLYQVEAIAPAELVSSPQPRQDSEHKKKVMSNASRKLHHKQLAAYHKHKNAHHKLSILLVTNHNLPSYQKEHFIRQREQAGTSNNRK